MSKPSSLLIGCAGWSLPKEQQRNFPGSGSHLERYARRFTAVEINSSFYRPHRKATYERWAEAVPGNFRFAVKIPKTITHAARLVGTDALLDAFLAEAGGLGEKLGVLLVQLPPSLRFDVTVAGGFFEGLRERHTGAVACEPRHPTWFGPEAEALLRRRKIARVAADPAPVPAGALPGGWNGLVYRRLHGSPKVYYSEYQDEFLAFLAADLMEKVAAGAETWCVFDNTAAGFAVPNALNLLERCSAKS